MNASMPSGALFASQTAGRRFWRLLPSLLVLALLISGFYTPGTTAPVVEAAAGPAFPPYVYVAISGPSSYDVMLNAAGKETRLSRVGTAGVGLSDVAAKIAPDGQHVAVRVSGSATGGSSLRVIEVKSSKAITVTLSRNADIGIGSFAWSPDSKTLAYTVASPQRADADSGAGVVWVVGDNGKGARKLAAPGVARLIGWSPDGVGVYYARDENSDSIGHLWYFPLPGGPRPVLASSPSSLQYSNFAVSPAPVVSGTVGAARIAALAIGDLNSLPQPDDGTVDAPRTRPAARLGTAAAPGVAADDGHGVYKALKDFGEAYKVLAWNPAGTHLLMSGGKSGTAWYADANTGQRWKLPASLNNMAPIAWTADSRYAVLADGTGAATRLITYDFNKGAVVRSRAVGAPAKAGDTATDLPIPYISQLWHTGVNFNGNWACGPTSVAMVLAYYGRLNPWPFPAGQARTSPQDRLRINAAGAEAGRATVADGNVYGQYIVSPFTYNGHAFTAWSKDPAGHRFQGLYGTIVGTDALAHWEQMIGVLGIYNINTAYIPVTWSAITAQLDKGNPVVLGTTLTASGHILVARGYTKNGYLLVNDPYGNRFGPSGYGANDGGDAAYAWKKIPAKLAMVTRGTITQPTPTPTATATATATSAATMTATPTPVAGVNPSATPVHGVNGP